jgi:hypothetical protein
MALTRDAIDAVLQSVLAQVPAMEVTSVSFSPANPREGDDVIARIDVSGAHVLCEILSDGRLQSARVIED